MASRRLRSIAKPNYLVDLSGSEFEGTDHSEDETHQADNENGATEAVDEPDAIMATIEADPGDQITTASATHDNKSTSTVRGSGGRQNRKTRSPSVKLRGYKAAGKAMVQAFYDAGHTSVLDAEMDEEHHLHALYTKVVHLLDDKCIQLRARGTEIVRAAEDAADRFTAKKADWQLSLPLKSEVLAWSFMWREKEVDKDLVLALMRCNSTHLLQVLDGADAGCEQGDAKNAGDGGLLLTDDETLTGERGMQNTGEEGQQSLDDATLDSAASEIVEWLEQINETLEHFSKEMSEFKALMENRVAMVEIRAERAEEREKMLHMKARQDREEVALMQNDMAEMKCRLQLVEIIRERYSSISNAVDELTALQPSEAETRATGSTGLKRKHSTFRERLGL